jgi:outer membrane protein assembly factor BamB/orotate phosphoribosyltransferase
MMLAAEVTRSPASSLDTEREALRRAMYAQVLLLGKDVTFDFKDLLSHAGHAHTAGRLLWDLIRPMRPEVLIGPGFGGAPLLYAVGLAALQTDGIDLTLLMVRDQRKTHYLKRWVEGAPCPAGARAVIVDDFLGKGTAVQLVDEALKADRRDLHLCGLAVLFDCWSPSGSRRLSVSRFPVASVFKRHDIGLSRDCHDARPPEMRGSAPAFVDQPQWWRFEFNHGSAPPYKSSPAIAEGGIFGADDRATVWRFDAETGETVWRRPSLQQPYKGIVQQLQVVDRSVVYGCYDGTVTRLDADNGEIVWRWRPDSHVHATPEVDLPNGRLFVNTEQYNAGSPIGHLYSLDWNSGQVIWQYTHGYWPPATAHYNAQTNAVIATCNDQSLVCVDADSGEVRWKASTTGMVRGKPAVSGSRVFVATEEGQLQSFDLETGERVRSRRHGPGLMHQFLHVADGVVYVLDNRWHLTAFDIDTFKIRWLSRLRSRGVWAPVAYGKYLIVLSRKGQLAVFDPAREIKLWEGQIGGTFNQQPAVGRVNGVPLLACASNDAGFKVFRIHPYYD